VRDPQETTLTRALTVNRHKLRGNQEIYGIDILHSS
jgi:hypothetical protein